MSPLFLSPSLTKTINQFALPGIFTIPLGYGAGGLQTGTQLLVRTPG